jgi:hypothetical protein
MHIFYFIFLKPRIYEKKILLTVPCGIIFYEYPKLCIFSKKIKNIFVLPYLKEKFNFCLSDLKSGSPLSSDRDVGLV